MSDAQALRAIANQMEDHETYRTDEMGVEALCLRNAADRIETLETELRLCRAERERAQKACEQIAERAALGEKKDE